MKYLSILLRYTLVSSICFYTPQLLKIADVTRLIAFMNHQWHRTQMKASALECLPPLPCNSGSPSHRVGGNKAVFPKSSICFPELLAQPPCEELICSQHQDVQPRFLRRGTPGISDNIMLYCACIPGSLVIWHPWPLSIRCP